MASILYTAWAILNCMNNLIFKHLQASPTSCVFQAFLLSSSYLKANPKTSNPNVSKFFHIKWQPPNVNQVKLNFDGSVRNGMATIGFVILNEDGNPLFAANRKLGHTSVLVVEATALRDSLHTALLHQHPNLVVEGDSKLLTDCVQGRCQIPWRIRTLVNDIKALTLHFQSIIFSHIFQEANFIADRLALAAHTFTNPYVWFFCLPLLVSPAFQLNQLGEGVCRGFVF
ncbi:uncharacterized protein LOC133730916 [Rosa rugosa]|uniref:uncharacterized protein LOC133730916 n=1 Tax=Rosa rugosa TaxID=74645 RepID=UPI002B406FA9|nr:uncharacterized protein LOC133730916 [Rosa rugosa]